MLFYSVIIPVYNRPTEIDELLHSLTKQTYKNFEVLVIDDGSTDNCEAISTKYGSSLQIRYFYKENEGQGFTRNYGFERAKGDYFIVVDSDCIIPAEYLSVVDNHLKSEYLDAFGGPDAADESFTPLQKAISYSMTSFFTTGGIRGGKKHIGQFHPRSFNMGISRKVWEQTRGYVITRMGEDIEFSIRIHKLGFKIGLIDAAKVYHKRRTSLAQFYKQLHFFGRARINIFRFYKSELKLVHTFPFLFTAALVVWLLTYIVFKPLFLIGTFLLLTYTLLLFFDCLWQTKSLLISILGVSAAFTQLVAYGVGFLTEGLRYFKQPKPVGLRKSSHL
jgi:glycosyltransferase involved in cell wall biosynthesis